jgi:hypothetical protein
MFYSAVAATIFIGVTLISCQKVSDNPNKDVKDLESAIKSIGDDLKSIRRELDQANKLIQELNVRLDHEEDATALMLIFHGRMMTLINYKADVGIPVTPPSTEENLQVQQLLTRMKSRVQASGIVPPMMRVPSLFPEQTPSR